MTDTLIRIQVLYEIALSIGTSLDMKTMLQKSLGTYLRKFSCAAGAVLQGNIANDTLNLDLLYSIPRAFQEHEIFKAALGRIPNNVPAAEIDDQLNQLPYAGSHGGYYYHIMTLPGFGLLLLIKHGSPLDPILIKSLVPLNAKLATACLSCLRKERIQTIAYDLKIENRQRRKAEDALSASHEQLENILDGLAAFVYVADLDTHEIIFANRYMTEQFGDNVVGRPCYEVVQGASRRCLKCQIGDLLDDQGLPVETVSWEEYNSTVSRWFMHHARAMPWKGGRMVRLQISTDISRLKQLEKERMKAAQRQQAQRLESLGTLAGGIAHEYNNLLMGMMGSVSIMRFDFKKTHPVHLNIDRIESNIRVAAELTDKLLGYAQKGRYEIHHIQVNEIISNLAKTLGGDHPAITFELDLDPQLRHVEVDRNQIAHALLNLLTNACDAMPNGGPILVQTVNRSAEDLKRRHKESQAPFYVRISVKDSGSGMTEETKDRIFEPFFTTKSVGRGAGLGMAATYGIVKGHQGFIQVASTLGQGSNLVVYLPAIAPSPPSRTAADVQQKAPSVAGKKIMLVDDEPIVLEIGKQMLAHLGHHVICVQNGQDAVTAFQQHNQTIDLVILDVVMPGMTGEQTYNQLKAINSKVKFFVSSGFSMDDRARSILIEEAEAFLQKPFSMEDLKKKLDKVFTPPGDKNLPSTNS